MKVCWAPRALRCLQAIGAYIGTDDPRAARRWIRRLRERARLAGRFPRAGRVVPEFGRDEVREILVRNYRIVYRILSKEVQVVYVFEGHQQLSSDDLPELDD